MSILPTGIPECDTAFATDTPADKNACAKEINRLKVTDVSLQDLRVEYKKLKKAYTPLNLLMERARDIPLESVWPGRVPSSNNHGLSKDYLQELVKAEVEKALPAGHTR